MKKFEFQLQRLLSYKGQLLDGELMTLAILNNLLEKEQIKRLKLVTEQIKCRASFEKEMKENTTPATCQVYAHYSRNIKDQIKECENEIQIISDQVEEQLNVVKKLKLEEKSLEKIKESRLDDYNKEDRKKAELHIEEFIATTQIMGEASS